MFSVLFSSKYSAIKICIIFFAHYSQDNVRFFFPPISKYLGFCCSCYKFCQFLVLLHCDLIRQPVHSFPFRNHWKFFVLQIMINFQNSPWGFVKNMCSLLVKKFDISSKSTLFLLLSNYTCYVYLTECGVLKSSTFIFLLMLSTLTRVFSLYIVKMFHLLDQVSCNYIFIEVNNYHQSELSYFPSNTFYPVIL